MNNLTITDKYITLAIEEAFATDDGLSAHLIDVEVNKGVVILLGVVPNLQAKEQARNIVETIKGVRAVVNRLEVKPVIRPDKEIEKDILKALLFDPATHIYNINAAVNRGVATLSGTVDSWQKKQLAEWVIKSVKGLKDVQNNIKVEYKTDRHDIEIKSEIEHRLNLDVWVDDASINVDVKDGEVTLAGTVASAAEKTRAYLDAWVTGATFVNDEALTVETEHKFQMRRPSAYIYKSDAEIKRAISDAFLYDPRVLSFNPQVEVNNGEVILTGVVDNLMAKKAAEQDAKNTVGVWRVKNYLKVRPADSPSDMEIAQHVREALWWSLDIDQYQIVVSCHNKKVYLNGAVYTNNEKRQVEDIANRVRGVVEVENHLRVDQTWQWKGDEEIKTDIESRLERNPFIEFEHIKLTVTDGIARLSGTVPIWQKRDIVINEAFKGGAKSVVSRIKVDYGAEKGESA